MIRAVIIDDEEDARQVIERLVNRYGDKLIEIVGEANSVESGIDLLDKEKPHLVFLDLHLYNDLGFEVIERSNHKNYYVVIVTAYEKYGIQAVKSGADDYLLKPINPMEFEEAIKKILSEDQIKNSSRFQPQNEFIDIAYNGYRKKIKLADILYIQADNNYSVFYLENQKKYTVAKTLKSFDEELSEYFFFRCHQSFFVNLRKIEAIKLRRNIILLGEYEIPISRRNKVHLLEIYDFITQSGGE